MALEGYTGINGRLPFYGQGEASDNKILNFQNYFWRMLRPYGILAYTRLDPLPQISKGGNLGEGEGGWRGTQVLTADYRFTVRAKHPTAKF